MSMCWRSYKCCKNVPKISGELLPVRSRRVHHLASATGNFDPSGFSISRDLRKADHCSRLQASHLFMPTRSAVVLPEVEGARVWFQFEIR